MVELSNNVIFTATILVGIVVVFIIGKAIHIRSMYHTAKDYNRFVYDYYGQFDKPTPILIVRYQNDYIRAYNEHCDTFIGKLFFFAKMPLVDDPSCKHALELFRPALPRDTSADYRYMHKDHPFSDTEINDAVNFSFKGKQAKRHTKKSVRNHRKNNHII